MFASGSPAEGAKRRKSGTKRLLDNSLSMTSAGHHHTPLCRATARRSRRRVGGRSTNSLDMEPDHHLRELIALCLLAGLGFSLAFAHDDLLFGAVFGGAIAID